MKKTICIAALCFACRGDTSISPPVDKDDQGTTGVGDNEADDTDTDATDDTDTDDTDTDMGPNGTFGQFTVEDGGSTPYLWTMNRSDDNYVHCKVYPSRGNDLWIRFAESRAEDGERSPHIDIDVCKYNGSGDYPPHDPLGDACDGQSWDIWWHPNQDDVFANKADADPCTLTLSGTTTGPLLEGTFSCAPLRAIPGGGSKLGITDGSFRCDLEPG